MRFKTRKIFIYFYDRFTSILFTVFSVSVIGAIVLYFRSDNSYFLFYVFGSLVFARGIGDMEGKKRREWLGGFGVVVPKVLGGVIAVVGLLCMCSAIYLICSSWR